jgi:hypothetical protein
MINADNIIPGIRLSVLRNMKSSKGETRSEMKLIVLMFSFVPVINFFMRQEILEKMRVITPAIRIRMEA